jgi:hypothetical protein
MMERRQKRYSLCVVVFFSLDARLVLFMQKKLNELLELYFKVHGKSNGVLNSVQVAGICPV